jgi:uncharacterized membrane protein YedE/YeeE
MPDVQTIATTVAWWGFGLGALFGFIANKTSFCTMGAVSDVVNMSDWGRMRAWLLAIAVAMIGTNALAWSGAIDLGKTIYSGQNLAWLANLVGGIVFGVGMTLASGCGNKTLVRIGAGNLKSLVVFVFMAIGAQLTLRGVFAPIRVNVLSSASVSTTLPTPQTLPHLLQQSLGLTLGQAELTLALLIGGMLMAFVLLNRDFHENRDNLVAGLVLGLVVVAGWYVTGKLGFAEDPDSLQEIVFGTNSKMAESMSFVAPSAYTLDLFAMWTDASNKLTWGIATVFGVTAGSLIYALTSKSFRWEYFISASDMGRHMIGGLMMGFGGVTAMGCTIGQGMTGVSTLGVGSLLALAGILAGSAAFMKYEYWKMMQEA